VTHNTHNLQLTVLFDISHAPPSTHIIEVPYLEALVLKNTLDSCVFSTWREFGLKYYTKGAVSYDFALSVRHLTGFAGGSILNLFTDDF
jgi:hypothetical protein